MLWHRKEPVYEDIIKAIDEFDFTGYEELVYCGYGEPTCALDYLLRSAKYAKEKYGVKIRVNTNGLGNLYHNKNIVPLLAEVADSVSISLNAPTREAYIEVTQPRFENAFEAMLEFISACKDSISKVRMTIVDILSKEDIEASRKLAQSIGVELKIRKYS